MSPRPKTGGRRKGTPNKATAEVKELAREHGSSAITELARLALNAESEQARVAARRELLDRAYGKPTVTLAGDPEAPLAPMVFIDRPPRETRGEWLKRHGVHSEAAAK